MFKKVLSLLLVLVMAASLCVAMASCNKNENGEDGLSASPLPEVELNKDFEVDADFKVDASCATVKYDLKPHKVFLFNAETEDRIYFEV